jgi:serine protease AprX
MALFCRRSNVKGSYINMGFKFQIIFIFALCCCGQNVFAQHKVWVFLQDKHGTQFNPYEYFDAKAIARRQLEGLSLMDSTDFPVNEKYVQQVALLADSVCAVSRWLNAVACFADDEQVSQIQQLPCVLTVQYMYMGAQPAQDAASQLKVLTEEDKAVLKSQTEIMHYSMLRNAGFTGKGVRIAVFDAGFKGFLTDSAFQNIIKNNQIKATYDFAGKDKFVFGNHHHGTKVMSCVGGYDGTHFFGCATDAEFLLARTEQAFWENKIEEENWVLSLEWADKWGADIVNSSLGYTNQFYFSKHMNGQKSIISKAASVAVAKGILVVNSAGNEGDTSWEVISAPADADSVLTIGGIDPWTGYHSDFSSYGPTSDFRMKPNLCAFGQAITTHDNLLELSAGTSFSSPLIAGFAACIKQMHPEWTVAKLYSELQHCAHLYPYFDYAHGFGIPQASYFFNNDSTAHVSDSLPLVTVEFQKELDRFRVVIDNKDNLAFDDEQLLWRKKNDFATMLNYVYVHVQDANGLLLSYEITKPGATSAAFIKDVYDDSCTLRVYWKGFTYAFKIADLKADK